jgi:S-formylglutathione hydrolase FrmB
LLVCTHARQALAAPGGKLLELKVLSESLKGNLLGDPADQPVAVYLPPNYETSPMKRFATLYLLHGFTGKIGNWTKNGYQGMRLGPMMDRLIAKGAIRDMVVVVPNGDNAYRGSFYTNSSVTGNWEDFISRDLVSYIDRNYRTIARAGSRGITGHSMGGYGAILMGVKHPDVFGAVYAMSPACLGFEADLDAGNPAWSKALGIKSRAELKAEPKTLDEFYVDAFVAMSAAFSPNPKRPPLYLDFPFQQNNGQIIPNESAHAAWRSKMPLHMIEDYKSNLSKLRGICIDVGEKEEFAHIRLTSARFSNELAKRNIPHVFEIYAKGDHGSRIRDRLETHVLQFFSSTLDFNP